MTNKLINEMSRHEVWRHDYRHDRYMEYLSNEDLEIRFDDVFRNNMTLTSEGRIGLGEITSENEYWMVMFTHLLEEIGLRGIGIESFGRAISTESIPKSTYPEAPKSVKALGDKLYKEGEHLFKYGNKSYLKRMYENGDIRISPASFYKDSSLNSAIYDDERILPILLRPDKVKITHISKKTGKQSEVKAVSNINYSFESKTNFYIFCMAYKYDHRLFGDFESNACIVVHDTHGFLSKLDRALRCVIGNWVYRTQQVKYVDPLNPPPENEIDVIFGKHFRYSYQKEVRSVWLPGAPVENLDPIYINIGSMESYADYVEF